MYDITTDLEKNGYCVVPNIINRNQAEKMQKSILNILEMFANEIDVSLSAYLKSVSRWAAPSPITEPFLEIVNNIIKPNLEESFCSSLQNAKINIIVKSPYAPSPTPCHQDISYTPHDPYDFSCWLALTDIDINDAPLALLPGSHLSSISTAIDFWQPNFIDRMRDSKNWENHAITCPIQSGSAIIFDSRLWHGSAPLKSSTLRIALVTRWKIPNSDLHQINIPAIKKEGFGMWTAGEITHQFLSSALNNPESKSRHDLIDLFISQYNLSSEAKQSLLQLKILHLAHEKHNGGDTQGEIYKNVWRHILSKLKPKQALATT